MRRRLRSFWGLMLIGAILALYLTRLGSLNSALFPPGSDYSDLMLTHWPNAHFFRESVLRDGCWPLWNPNLFSGVPFAANPLSGLWYPPNWLFLILPITPALNLLLMAHLAWGGLGMMRLVRLLAGTGRGALAGGLVAGLAWALAPKVWAHLGAGHVGLVFAAGWLPWVAHAALRMVRGKARTAPFELVFVWGLQFLADPRLAALTAMGVAGIAGYSLVARRHDAAKLAPGWLAAGALALGLTAVQWLPLLDYLPRTARSGLSAGESAAYSLPPGYLLGLIWADRGGFQEWMTYLGISVLALAALGWLTLPGRVRWGAAAGLALAVLFSLGEHTPFYALVTQIPGATLLRVPPRAWFLVGFGAAVLAGLGAAQLAENGPALARHRRSLNRLAVAAMGAVTLLAAGVMLAQPVSAPTAAVASAGWLALTLAILAVVRRKGMPGWAVMGFPVLLVLAELAWMDLSLVVPRPEEQLFADGQETAAWLGSGDGRVYSPSFRPPPQVAAIRGLRVVNGVDPLQPADYAIFLNAAAGVPPSDRYSVTLPPLPEGAEVLVALADMVPDPTQLALLNVQWVVSQFSIQVGGLEQMYRNEHEELTVYRNQVETPLPAVYGQVASVPDLVAALGWLASADPEQAAMVTGGRALNGQPGRLPAEQVSARQCPNRLAYRATGPGLLVVSEVYDPGWRATVDGQPAEIVPADGVLRGVYLGAGEHEVEMVYRPLAVMAGMLASAITLVHLAAGWRLAWRSDDRDG